MIKEDSERRQITQAKRCIHTTCECSDRYIALIIADSGISIHAAREGGDNVDYSGKTKDALFHSTPPVKAATNLQTDDVLSAEISIHAAREGGDESFIKIINNCNNFNPRRP